MSFSPSSSSSRDTSPDPIVLPSSPLGGHRSARKSSPRRSSRKIQMSPSKSLVLDTPNGAGGESPWRIRVTVEAEPRASSIAKKTSRRSASPTKKSTRIEMVPLKVESPAANTKVDGDVQMQRNTRKRKGTPLRRGRSTRHQPPAEIVEPVAITVEDRQDEDGHVGREDQDAIMPPPPPPPAKRRISGRIGRLNSQSAPTLRSQRLSLAREELDIALQDAVGYGEDRTTRLLGEVDFSKSTRMLGDATLSRNEDFSMISVDTLQTAKDSSHLGNSTSSASGYMASSLPKKESLRRSVLGEPVEFGRRSVLGNPVQFGRSSALGSSVENGTRRASNQSAPLSNRNGADVMSWRATGPPVVIGDLTLSSQVKPDDHLRRSASSQRNESSRFCGVNGANADDEDISQGLEADIWQDEASRSLQEQPGFDDDHQDDDDDYDDGLHTVDQLQSDAAAQSASRSTGLEDIFADQPLRPARGKIPKTWRRSSGMDFSYIDSPGHGMIVDEERTDEDEKRHSTNGSGVLTPPGTSDEGEHEEGEQEEERQTGENDDRDELIARKSDDDHRQEYDDDQELQSEWNQPDAEATRYEGQHEFENQDTTAGNEGASPLSDDKSDDDDTGNFFQHNMPQLYARQNQPRRPPPRPRPTKDEGTVDLTDLLGLQSSPTKKTLPASHTPVIALPVHASSSTDARSTKLHGQAYDGKMKFDPQVKLGKAGKAKVVNSPLRKSLLKSSKMHGGSPDHKMQLHHHHRAPAPALSISIIPAGKQQISSAAIQSSSSDPVLSPAVLDRSQTHFPNSQSRVELELDSFASKASDQRQLLMEMTPRVPTGVNQSYARAIEMVSSSPAPVVRSYEENLNRDSPQKIPVHFGDSSSVLPSTKLFLNRTERKNLEASHFGASLQQQPAESQGQKRPLAPKPIAMVDKRQPATVGGVGGLLSRLSETFWSAIVRPTGPTAIFPERLPHYGDHPESTQGEQHAQKGWYQGQRRQQGLPQDTISTSWQDDEEEFSEERDMFNTTLRTAIRNRYGVLQSSFPWTMAHMRTLHRMLNSLMSERPDSLIPNAGPLPDFLLHNVDTMQESVVGDAFLFTREHAYVVFSFLQILVEDEVVRAMERGEVQELGDGLSRMLRGVVEGDTLERKGSDVVFRQREGWREQGKIGWEFVVGALGCAVRSNELGKGKAGSS